MYDEVIHKEMKHMKNIVEGLILSQKYFAELINMQL
jgi:hypothetical protein